MRGLQEDWFIENSEDIKKLKNMLNGKDRNDYFVGVRNNSLIVYYRGMKLVQIEKKENRYIYTMDKYYRENVDGKSNDQEMDPVVFWNEKTLDELKARIESHIYGNHGVKHRLQQEKICQQWIMNQANSNPTSEWYYVDMEYVLDTAEIGKSSKEKHPYGRADMIAIKKCAGSKGHEVAFVELKIGTESYGGSIKFKAEEREEQDSYRKIVRGDEPGDGIYDERIRDFKLGSGIVSHLVDYFRLFSSEKFYQDTIRQEIVNYIMVHKELGLINDSDALGQIISKEEIAKQPKIFFVSYGKVPDFDKSKVPDCAKHRIIDIRERGMKESFYKYLYDKRVRDSAINVFRETDIEGLLKRELEFAKFCKTEERNLCIKQKIRDRLFDLNYTFIYPTLEDANWNCLE